MFQGGLVVIFGVIRRISFIVVVTGRDGVKVSVTEKVIAMVSI